MVLFIMALSCLDAQAAKKVKKDRRVVAYVTSWSGVMPDPAYMTNIIYAFGHVNDTFDGVKIDNPERLRRIAQLKRENPGLEVQLAIGGWGSGGFSEMAADPKLRKKFAEDCKRIVKEYGLDGIDIDWEYPGSGAAGISSSPDDKENFTLLMKDLRKALGKKKLLTMASIASAAFVDFPAIMKYVDFVNVMAYDLASAPNHHSPLHSSATMGRKSAESSVKAHLEAGVPASRLVLGIPFYGRGSAPYGALTYYRSITIPEGYSEQWDSEA
ncbi:MAG: glycosyl hydrolase family 18, partial [Muribaculaceae bacterium]|nr:glycosyl hydrolase family 18 [Muribaculaceae bacterium]